MKRTHPVSFSSSTKEIEGDTYGNDSIIMNHYKNYEEGMIPWPPKNYTCSFCRRDFRSAQALGGHMNVHRRDRAKLRQIPSWLFEPHHHIPARPNLNSSSSTSLPHHEPSLINQISISTTRFDILDNDTSCEDLMVESEKNNNNVRSRDLKKSAMDTCQAAKCEMIRGDLMNKKDGVMGLELGMSLRNPKQVLDLELRLGCL